MRVQDGVKSLNRNAGILDLQQRHCIGPDFQRWLNNSISACKFANQMDIPCHYLLASPARGKTVHTDSVYLQRAAVS